MPFAVPLCSCIFRELFAYQLRRKYLHIFHFQLAFAWLAILDVTLAMYDPFAVVVSKQHRYHQGGGKAKAYATSKKGKLRRDSCEKCYVEELTSETTLFCLWLINNMSA